MQGLLFILKPVTSEQGYCVIKLWDEPWILHIGNKAASLYSLNHPIKEINAWVTVQNAFCIYIRIHSDLPFLRMTLIAYE